MRMILAAVLLAVLPGCATTWTILRLGGVVPEEGSYDTVEPRGPEERRLVVVPRLAPREEPPAEPAMAAVPEPEPEPAVEQTPPPSAEPIVVVQPPVVVIEPPVVYVPAPPPPSEAPPEAQPEPPPAVPAKAVRFDCAQQQRHSRELVRHERFSYGYGWKVTTAFCAVSEMAVAGLLLAAFSQGREQGDRADPTALAMSTVFALDALGSAALFFHPSERATTQYEREGAWSSTPGCPAGLAVVLGGREYAVSPEGRLEREAGEWVYEQLTAPERAFELRFEDRTKSVRPTAAERCEWARRQGRIPPPGQCPFFGLVLGEPAQTILELAPPAASR